MRASALFLLVVRLFWLADGAFAPDLSAGRGVVVQQYNLRPCMAAVVAAADAGGTGADDEHLCVHTHVGFYRPCRMAEHLAGAAVRDAVDRRAAFEADAHAAECGARLAR